MNKEIKIEDYPCGSGKTTRMIENFKEDQKYLVILPSLSEVDRVIEGSKDIEFVQPYANDNDMEEDFKTKAAELITIEDIGALSKLKLTYSGQEKGISSSSYYSKVSRSLKNLKERKLVGVGIKNILITCKKDAWRKASNDNQPKPESEENEKTKSKPSVFAKNSRLKDVNWISNTTRGTNDYIHCSHLVYLYDQNINPVVARWLGDSSRAFNDAYALTELIQWVWRSRVRKGEPITLYLPSPRMRRLFEEWLYNNQNNKNQSL